MNAAEFRSAWEGAGDRLYQYPVETISTANLPAATQDFLVAGGLPQEAAPFLTFGPETLDWLRQPGDDLDRLYALGSDGSGDPLAVDDCGRVWQIDHERPHRKVLVNTSVAALAQCLLAYRTLIAEAVTVGGEDAFLDGRIARHAIDAFYRSIDGVDREAAGPGTFWGQELSRLMEVATD
ncbi:MAG: SUKH-4 family immunity protein [Proteobacteria bacterium]|nr:SUKH-4 family immunity protein [Pseudomonadota bacterium]